MSAIEVREGSIEQGTAEAIRWPVKIDASWGTPAAVASTVVTEWDGKLDAPGLDVTSAVMPSTAALVNGQVIKLGKLQALVAGKMYRVVAVFSTVEGDDRELRLFVQAV